VLVSLAVPLDYRYRCWNSLIPGGNRCPLAFVFEPGSDHSRHVTGYREIIRIVHMHPPVTGSSANAIAARATALTGSPD
jgi:hypothetical protein